MVDAPDHTRLRRLVSREFTRRRVQALRPAVERIAQRLLDDLIAGPAGRSRRDLRLPLPALVICELLGVPEVDIKEFRSWVDIVTRSDAGAEQLTGSLAREQPAASSPPNSRRILPSAYCCWKRVDWTVIRTCPCPSAR
jgi:cytochrome P450